MSGKKLKFFASFAETVTFLFYYMSMMEQKDVLISHMNGLIGGYRVAVAVGTRPEIIKMNPVIKALQDNPDTELLLINTGQHYDPEMSDQFWVSPPDISINAGGLDRAHCIATITAEMGSILHAHRPDVLLVHGDTNTTLASALAANAENVRLAHVEAGLRSYDRAMPEEHNRVLTDHLADICFAPTVGNRDNLLREGIPLDRIDVVGNTIVETVRNAVASIGEPPCRDHILVTIHRPENTDDPKRLARILQALNEVPDMPVVIPLHPRTVAKIKEFELDHMVANFLVVPPLGASEFLALESSARLIVSDSGGVAEEVTILKRPLIIVRNSTERPEAIDAGFAQLVGPDDLSSALSSALRERRDLSDYPSPYGDGTTSARIVERLLALLRETEASYV